MSGTDYQASQTELYNRLSSIEATLAKLALMSNVNTIQVSLQSTMNALVARVDTLTTEVEKLQLTMSDLLIELRNK